MIDSMAMQRPTTGRAHNAVLTAKTGDLGALLVSLKNCSVTGGEWQKMLGIADQKNDAFGSQKNGVNAPARKLIRIVTTTTTTTKITTTIRATSNATQTRKGWNLIMNQLGFLLVL